MFVCVYVGTVLAPCRGETQAITGISSRSAMTMAASRLLASPWPHW